MKGSGSGGEASYGKKDGEDMEDNGNEGEDGRSGAKPQLRVFIPGQKEFIPRTVNNKTFFFSHIIWCTVDPSIYPAFLWFSNEQLWSVLVGSNWIVGAYLMELLDLDNALFCKSELYLILRFKRVQIK